MRHLLRLTLSAALLSACARTSIHRESEDLTSCEQVQDIILDLPHWLDTAVGYDTDAAPFDASDLAAYEVAATQLKTCPSADIRDGIALAMSATSTRGAFGGVAHADIFVLLRVLYDVPVSVPGSTLQVGSPYAVFVQRSGADYQLLWPVEFDSSGSVATVHNFLAAMGGDYAPLDEFDWLDTAYKRR